MIQPEDFLQVAKSLEIQPDEPHARTAINRAYYAAFLYFREFLVAKGIDVPEHKNKSQHQFIIECFRSR